MKPETMPTANEGRILSTYTPDDGFYFLIQEGTRYLGFSYDEILDPIINEHRKDKHKKRKR